jgi:penicillin-binding protein 1C
MQSSSGLKIMGLPSGTRLRSVPGKREIQLTLEVVGGSGKLYWLLDGQQIEQAKQSKRQTFKISGSGQHSISVIDSAGRDDSMVFWVDELR